MQSLETDLIHVGYTPKDNAIVPPTIPAVAYAFSSVERAGQVVRGEEEGVYYGRYGNPTTAILEEKIAHLESAEAAVGVNSGMAAISTALLTYLKQGDHVVLTKDIYGGTHKFITSLCPRFGITYSFVDCTDLESVEKSIQTNTKVLYIETPSNPCLTILDIEALSKLAHAYNLKVIVDNTFMTPYLQKPIVLGADIVVHSATKYLNGHGDVIAGFIVGKKKDMDWMRKNVMGDLGQILNAWAAFLILRGIKTLALRMRQHCDSAQQIARFLDGHPAIDKVYYPGLQHHPQYELAHRQMKDMGGIVSFEVKGGYESAKRFVNALNMVMISFSLGDPESLVQHPASMTHHSIPKSEREKFNITDGLVRLSTGLECTDDIIRDLDQALMAV